MSTEVYISRYDDQTSPIPISLDEWEACVQAIKELRINKEYGLAIETFIHRTNEWIPVFWINGEQGGSMRQAGFFHYDEIYGKAIEIAEYLHAYIYFENGDIMYLPGYGVLFDDCEVGEQPLLNLDELANAGIKGGENFKSKINDLIHKKTTTNHATGITPRKWWEFWK